jgi:hypothetical protein
VSAHRASLEEAYMELTRDAVDFRAVSGSEGAGAVWTDEQRSREGRAASSAGGKTAC